jgi:signal transduction histidine kinase
MDSSEKPAFEEQRLQALKALHLPESSQEKDFDNLTLIAAQIFGSHFAAISFLDGNRQWFKSKIGIQESEVARENSFCHYTITANAELVVANAANDERFSAKPVSFGDQLIRFYAGVPVLCPEGFPVGSLFVCDSKECEASTEKMQALKALSQQVTVLLNAHLQNEKLQNLKERAGYKRTVIENLSEGIVLLNGAGKVIECNPAAAELLGLEDNGQVLGRFATDKSGWKNITEEGTKFPESELPSLKCLRTGERQTNVILGIYRTATDLRWLNVNSIPLFLEPEAAESKRPTHVITSFTDITAIKAMTNDRRYLEAKLSDSSRRSALGEMAGGIAHEINNPLAIIVGRIYLLKEKLVKGRLDLSNLADFEKIEETVERIAKIIKSLKTYSRNAENDPFVKAGVSDMINETLELCTSRFTKEGVRVEIQCEQNYIIECRPAQISQLLMNLFNNSFDAVEHLSEKWIFISVEMEHEQLKLVVTDSGHGIPQAQRGKIMQPFYSTKEFGKAMGLGLSIALGIAESHSGRFEYDGSSNNTSFVLTLPSRQPIKKSA